jgi:tRNA(Ile)-lysidine synthase
VNVPPGGNLQARARAARYAALRRALQETGSTRIATAHHADDRAETVVLRILGGAGPGGLAVLAPAEEDRVRPFIRARQADIHLHLTRHDIDFSEDPSNTDRRYLRARVRFDLMPLLKELSPGVIGHLTALADALALGSPPALLDAEGNRVSLKRAHVDAIRRALATRTATAVVRLPKGRTVRVDGKRGALHVEGPDGPGAARNRREAAGGPEVERLTQESPAGKTELRGRRTSRGAKPWKSG